MSGQTVKTIAAAATAGTTATIAVTTTPSLPTAAQVQASLNTITGLTGNVTVTGNPGGPFTITVKNGGNIANLDVSHFTGGLTAVVTPISDGGATSDLDQLMSVTSHELAEAVTDPNRQLQDRRLVRRCHPAQIGDITAASTHTTRLGSLGYLTQNLFDQKVNITAADATATPLITLPTITGANGPLADHPRR